MARFRNATIAIVVSLAAATGGTRLHAESGANAVAALETAYNAIRGAEFVDLTHAFNEKIPHWKGFEPATATKLFSIEKDGFTADRFSHPGQWGTHVDPPAHFHKRLKTVDQLDPKDFVLRLAVFDIHEKVAANPDYVITLDDVKAWEAKHGPVPEGAFAALRTDWSKRWPDDKAIQNTDANSVSHYPGWSKEVLQYLYETRKITASGHETTDTDPGLATTKDDYSLESYILSTNHFQIELLTNLDKVPEAGALVLVTFPKPEHGSGFPARVVAIISKS
jgi:kynurenine formamidase